MRYFYILVFLSLSLNADWLLIKNNRCVYDLYPNDGSAGWCYTYRDNDRSYCATTYKYTDFIDGYEYNTTADNCRLKNDLKISGLTQNQWDYMLAVLAHVLGFTMVFLISFLSVLVARR